MAEWISGALDRIRETQHLHTADLKEIKRLLKQQSPEPHVPIDWNKHLPRIYWVGLVLGLAAANYRLPDILQIVSHLP